MRNTALTGIGQTAFVVGQLPLGIGELGVDVPPVPLLYVPCRRAYWLFAKFEHPLPLSVMCVKT